MGDWSKGWVDVQRWMGRWREGDGGMNRGGARVVRGNCGYISHSVHVLLYNDIYWYLYMIVGSQLAAIRFLQYQGQN